MKTQTSKPCASAFDLRSRNNAGASSMIELSSELLDQVSAGKRVVIKVKVPEGTPVDIHVG